MQTKQQQHHDLALKILVGRSLPQLPWTLAEDQELLAQERVLWSVLTEEEHAQEQETLMTLWGSRRAVRTVPVNPAWGTWAEGLTEVVIPNSAFGIPSNDLRPYAKGNPLDEDPKAVWLYKRGFQVVDANGNQYTLLTTIPRGQAEADRLLGFLARRNPDSVHPWGSSRGGVQMRSTYDPVAGSALLELVLPDGIKL